MAEDADNQGGFEAGVPKVEGAGPNCGTCFAQQVEAQKTAIENGEEPKPLCNVARLMQAQLDESRARSGSRPAAEQDNLHAVSFNLDGKMGG